MARKKPVPSKATATEPSTRNVVAEARGTARKAPPTYTWQQNLKSVLWAVGLFLFLRIFLIQAFRIPSESMVPTLLVGDWLFVNKLVYGPRIPFTNVRLPGYSEPDRFEVVVFKSTYQADEAAIGQDPEPMLVKRLVGLPGDTVYMREGILHVNGTAYPQGPEYAGNPMGEPNEVSPLFGWQLRHHVAGTRFGDPPERPTHDHWGPLLVPEAQYLMLGDNRYRSKDGRYWGLIPRENFAGRPLFVYYSWNAHSQMPLAFLREIRWSRLGHRIR